MYYISAEKNLFFVLQKLFLTFEKQVEFQNIVFSYQFYYKNCEKYNKIQHPSMSVLTTYSK